MAIEIVDFPMKNGDFPLLCKRSPEGKQQQPAEFPWGFHDKQQKWRNHGGYLSKWRNNGGFMEKQWITTIYWISWRSLEINGGVLLRFGMGIRGDENRDLRYLV